jgi:hypothetical protein
LRAVPAVADGHPQGQLIAPLAAQTAALVALVAEVEAANAELPARGWSWTVPAPHDHLRISHVSEAGRGGPRRSRRIDLKTHGLRQPCLSRQLRLSSYDRVADEIYAHELHEDTGHLAVRRPV